MAGLWQLQPNGQLKAEHLIDYGDEWAGASVEPPGIKTKIITGLKDATPYEVSIRYRMGKLISQTRRILGPATTGESGVPGASMVTPPNVVIELDYTGAVISDQLPKYLQFSRLRGAEDKTSVATWSVTARTGTIDSNTDIEDTGDATPGRLTLAAPSGGSPPSGTVAVTSILDGEPLTHIVTVTTRQAAAPTATSDTSLANVTSTTEQDLSDILEITPTGTSVVLTASGTYSNTGGGSGAGDAWITTKWLYSSSGAFGSPSDVGAYVDGTQAVEDIEIPPEYGGGTVPGSPGSFTNNQTKTGLSAGVAAYFKLVGKAKAAPTGGYPITFASGSAEAAN